MSLPHDYVERVYAGVLGKIIGVYLGRPFEGWSYERILEELGEINYYVHEKLGKPLIVTDDDITGTFTFMRAMEDYGNSRDLTARQIGHTWMNYLIEERTILWWGGLGNSTEHTAYLRMKHGIEAPDSGSMATNSQVVAEQIGAQIFIDGWAMMAPDDPPFAAELARRAASVSHDGEAIYGARVLAAMESQAFVEDDLDKLLDTGLSVIPHDSVIATMIRDLRALRQREPDWRQAFFWLREHYGYDKYGGNVHMVPNHGLMILSLLYGEDDFQKTMMIVNTCGWDTDCNSGNIGCLMGIKNGLAGLESGPDYRGPVADRLYLPAADGGSAVTDAVIQTYKIVNMGRALQGLPALTPKNGARFHFEFPGAVQNFVPEDSIASRDTTRLGNVAGHSITGNRSLAIHYDNVALGRPSRTATATWLTPETVNMPGYGVIASPTLYPGQTVTARLEADAQNQQPITCALYLRYYGAQDTLENLEGPHRLLQPGDCDLFTWEIPDLQGYPIAEVGCQISSIQRVNGTIYLDYLTWDGAPDVELGKTPGGVLWRYAWVNGVNVFHQGAGNTFLMNQNEGTGLLIHGTRQWSDVTVSADVTPHMVASAGIAARVQGLRRYYALKLVACGKLQLVRALDNQVDILAETVLDWSLDTTYELSLEVKGNKLRASVDGIRFLAATDGALTCGGIALLVEEGRTETKRVKVQPS
ncbi:MAG: ADP-ribosylglycohydrolase family protein [Anaerolineae bacterium]|nr:ADP-ribosylglycohydrolase family protein [Anaerolineae bacterium]